MGGRPFCFQFSLRLARYGRELISEHSFKPLLLVLIVQHDDWNHAHRALAVPADGHFALQILQEAVREAVQRPLAPCVLCSHRPAMRAGEFNDIFLWIAVQRGPPGVANSERLSRLTVHDTGTIPFATWELPPTFQMHWMVDWMQFLGGNLAPTNANLFPTYYLA
jgi:hypothetical protein